MVVGRAGAVEASGALVQLSGRNSRNASNTGTSRDANVCDTSFWHLAFFPTPRHMERDAHRVTPLLGPLGIVDDQSGIVPIHRPVGCGK